jgi:hypothetical protein
MDAGFFERKNSPQKSVAYTKTSVTPYRGKKDLFLGSKTAEYGAVSVVQKVRYLLAYYTAASLHRHLAIFLPVCRPQASLDRRTWGLS